MNVRTNSAMALALSLAAISPAQTDAKPTSRPSVGQKIDWPTEKNRVVCVVGGKEHTIGDVIAYVEERHWPQLEKFLGLTAGKLYFEQPIIALWVRLYADIRALELEAQAREIPRDVIDAACSESLKTAFERYFEEYRKGRLAAGHEGEPTQAMVNHTLADFQRRSGFETELQGWLDAMVPALTRDDERELRSFYRDHAQFFGGRVTVSAILVHHRDPVTGELLVGEARRAAQQKIRDIESRLKPDGSNFEDVARLLSDDKITAGSGGVLANVRRFDPLLPAVLCRKAWSLSDGRFAGPFESRFGTYFVKRLAYTHKQYVIYTEQLKPEIIAVARMLGQENLLFGVREKYGVQLRY